jgi:hypothetical protein
MDVDQRGECSEHDTKKLVERHLQDKAIVKRFKQQLSDLNATLSEMCENGFDPELEVGSVEMTRLGRPLGRTYRFVKIIRLSKLVSY